MGLAIWLTLRIHAAASYRIALGFFSLGILGFAALYFAGVTDIRWFLAVAIIAGLGRGALNYIPWSVYNYMPDVDEIVTGRRREGAFAGVMTFIRKLLQSAVVFAVGPILDASGLVRNVKIQPVQVVNTAVTIMLVGSLGLMIFGFLVSLRFKLNRDTHTVLMDEIERFKKQPGTQPTARESRDRRRPHGLEIRRALGKRQESLELRAHRIFRRAAIRRRSAAAGREHPAQRQRLDGAQAQDHIARVGFGARDVGVHGVVDELRLDRVRRLRAGNDPR